MPSTRCSTTPRCCERGIGRFRCHVLADNEEVKALLGDLRPYVTPVQEDGLRAYDVALPRPEEKMAESPLLRLFHLAATGVRVVLRLVGLPLPCPSVRPG